VDTASGVTIGSKRDSNGAQIKLSPLAKETDIGNDKVPLRVATAKRLTFIRHGQSEANYYWNTNGDNAPKPWFYDPALTEIGIQQAQERAKETRLQYPGLIVVAPLRRAIQTALIVWGHMLGKVPFIILPLCTEQVTESDDIGRTKSNLIEQFPESGIDWSHVGEHQFWWYIPDNKKVEGELYEDFKLRYKTEGGWEEPLSMLAKRVVDFESWLTLRQESNIAVVSHGDFIRCMTGVNLKNGAQLAFDVDPLVPLTPYLGK